ncbi:hypothetical protein P171DRAFT_49417 [Karstenula rhodostoma CBS 690.94]|uniref:Uncharacterized protein n=1 Tax=Karstenula rhodostoma CBS 690.94 TaxID=1392251 RepID=A0A9P4PF71_9PLEO|nr:hypothetical protein P171DRAFT_49417 [Karstenula rhodostoma CBS 690.94]
MPPKRQALPSKLDGEQSEVEPTFNQGINMSLTNSNGGERVPKRQRFFAPGDAATGETGEYTNNQFEVATNKTATTSEDANGVADTDRIDNGSISVQPAGPATVPPPPTIPQVVVNHPLVDRTLFPNAPDPAQNHQGAQAYANLAYGKTLPTRGPLACIGTSRVPAYALCAIEDHIFRGLPQKDCLPNYRVYSGNSTNTVQAISQVIAHFGSMWFEEEGFVQPWKVYRREGKAALKAKGVWEAHLPASYPSGTGYPPAGYQPPGSPVPLSHAAPTTIAVPAPIAKPAAIALVDRQSRK